MNIATTDKVLAVAAIALTILAAEAWRRPLPTRELPASPVSGAPVIPANLASDTIERAADEAIDANPFRLSRAPSEVPYTRARTVMLPNAPQPPRIRPTMVVKGIIGGPPFQAVVDGIPGAPPGTVVRNGSTFDQLTVRSVTRDSVIVQGPDTTWRLGLRRGGP